MNIIDSLVKSDDLYLLIDEYYETLDLIHKNDFVLGQFVSGIMVYPTDKPLILNLKDYDPINEENTIWNIEEFDPTKDYSHRPVYKDHLKSDEHYFVQRGKIRTCVVLNRYQSRWTNKNYNEEIYLCAPLYTFKEKHEDEYILQIIKFQTRDCFFLPKSINGILKNSVLRFSRILPMHKSNLKAIITDINGKPKPFKLSDEALKLFSYHLSKYLNIDYEEFLSLKNEIEAYRELIDESIIIN